MLTESMEDYLETIYRLSSERGFVRAVEVSERLGIQASSVTRMIQKLHGLGYLRYEKYRNIDLLPPGRRYGRFLVWRDQALEEFLRFLSAGAGIEDQVEGIEHYVTPATMCLIRDLNAFFAVHPEALAELRRLGEDKTFPDGEDLADLRAWSFKHSLED